MESPNLIHVNPSPQPASFPTLPPQQPQQPQASTSTAPPAQPQQTQPGSAQDNPQKQRRAFKGALAVVGVGAGYGFEAGVEGGEKGSDGDVEREPPPTCEDFPLVKKGILTVTKLKELVDMFFSKVHFIFPIFPVQRIPRTLSQLAQFAKDELHLTTTAIVIASRHDKNTTVHEQSWAYLQTLINDIILGKSVAVGAVEALLLLSEYLPRQPDLAPAEVNAEENRMSWMLVGTAVRLGYMLRLDEASLQPAKSLAESTDNSAAQELLNRERVAWTYCYLFDRQISIRTGKAFWSRGPGLCFSGGAGGIYPTAAKNFPSLRFIPEVQDDYASLLQAYVELSQIMTSTNDILYPSKDRTLSLVRLGEYYKFLDEFTRSLEAFRVTWEGKRWATYPLTECVWITFHYLRLYIYAFAFQAHVQRATWDAGKEDEGDAEHSPSKSVLFPSGLVASPDAKFILEAIDAAADLLRLVTDRLHPGGALPFLPSRFFMMFSYAGVFLLKAVYVEAVAPTDKIVIIRLLKRLIFVLACASTDEQSQGVRYARLLNGLLRAFSRGHESMAVTRAPTPARRNSISGETPDVSGVAPSPAVRPDLDFTVPWGASPAGEGALFSSDQQFSSLFGGSGAPGSSAIPASAMANPGATAASSGTATPFPMLPFSESQPFHRLASTLDTLEDNGLNLDFDFGFEDPAVPAAPAEAFNFLLEDHPLDFWSSFSTGTTQGGENWHGTQMNGAAGGTAS
ncbi:hypothetical protein MNV49_002862 [Pseudohyphozyma bogoriensis]|nr:hypothetical protein MNV49_002862 [Pseudohyphozyma bogoriensis]